MKKNFTILCCLIVMSFFSQLNAQPYAPSAQASNVQVSYKYTSGMAVTVTWTRGNGGNCIAVIRKASSSHYSPPSSTSVNYSATGNYGGGSSLGGGDNFVVYNGTGTGVYIYNLTPNTLYDVYIYEYNTYSVFGVTYYYNTSTSAVAGFSTLAAEPTSCSTISSASSITGSSATINFSAGTGQGRLLTMCPNSVSGNNPSDGYNYSASTVYGSGASLGSAYVVYNSAGTSVNVTGLMGATTYKAYDYEYSNGTYPTYSTYNYNTKNYLSCGTFTFNTTNVPPTINTVPNYTICQDVSWQTISLSGITDGSTNENQTVSISASSSNTTLIPNGNLSLSYASPNSTGYFYYYPVAGQYGTAVLTLTLNDGWSVNNITTKSFTVTVLPKPGAAGAISGTSPICAGSSHSYSIAATTNTTGYVWTVPSTFTVTSGSNTNNVTVATTSASAGGTIYVYAVNTNGCGNGATSLKSIQVDQQPADPYAGPDQSIVCSNAAFTNATAPISPDSGAWSWLPGPSALIGNPKSNQTSVNPLNGSPTPTTYKLLWTVKRYGSVCPVKTDTLILTADFNNAACTPSANFSYGPSSDVAANKVCLNAPVTFVDLSVSADTWLWDFQYTGSVGTYTSNAQNPTWSYSAPGTYTVYLKIHSNTTGLDYTTTKTVTVIDAPATPGAISGAASGICEGGSSGQQNYSIAAVTDATGYSWSVPPGVHIDSYPSITSVATSYPAGSASGQMSVTASNSCGTSAATTLSITVNPLPNTGGNNIVGPAAVCQGQNNITYSISIANATSYLWTDINGIQTNTTSSFTTNVGPSATTGTIAVVGSNSCGTGDTARLVLTINLLPVNNGSISGISTIGVCPLPDTLTYAISPAVDNATSYTWAVPSGASVIGGNGMDTIQIHFDNTVAGGYNQLSVYGSNGCGMSSVSNYSVYVNTPSAPQICMVTVDSASTHNIVYWDKTTITNADSFRIYREDVSNVYTHIGTVSYNSISEYHDMDPAADPNVTTKRYKISSVDSCGNESPLSLYHNTIFISDNGSGQFNWNLYTIEPSTNPVTSFELMVDTNNTGYWKQIGSTAGTQQILNDPNYANYSGVANWRVETVWGISCVSTARTGMGTAAAIVRSKSNISNNRGMSAAVKNNSLAGFGAYPNPTNGNVTITFNSAIKGKTTIKVVSLLGEEVYNETFTRTNSSYKLDLSNYQNGVYLVQIISGDATVTKRIVKN